MLKIAMRNGDRMGPLSAWANKRAMSTAMSTLGGRGNDILQNDFLSVNRLQRIQMVNSA